MRIACVVGHLVYGNAGVGGAVGDGVINGLGDAAHACGHERKHTKSRKGVHSSFLHDSPPHMAVNVNVEVCRQLVPAPVVHSAWDRPENPEPAFEPSSTSAMLYPDSSIEPERWNSPLAFRWPRP